MNPRQALRFLLIGLTAAAGLLTMACGDDRSGDTPAAMGSHAASSRDGKGEDGETFIVPITEAEEASFSCGEYGFGMGISESDLPMVQCIIDKTEGEEGRAELLSGMMQDAIYSSNPEAVRILLDAGVDADGRGPDGSPFLFHAVSSLSFSDSGNAAVVAETLVDWGARIPDPVGGSMWTPGSWLPRDRRRGCGS